MTLIELKDHLLFVISQSFGTTVPRLFAILFGILLCLVVMQSVWERRSLRIRMVLLLLAGVVSLVSGIFPGFLHSLVRVTDPNRLRILVGFLSSVVLLVTFESIRRSLLRERYALLWMVTGLLLLVSAIVPQSVDLIGMLFGTDYWVTVVGILAGFILFIAFHFSLAFSKHENQQQKMAQRCAALESRIEQMESASGRVPIAAIPVPSCLETVVSGPVPGSPVHIKMPGAYLLLLLVVVVSVVVHLFVGLMSREPMIGDEVTHYFMLTHQAENLPTPSFASRIPVGWGDYETRMYPHVNGWHYLGAIIYRFLGRTFASVQVYHTFFWMQFLLTAGWLARRRNGKISRVPVLYVLLLATLPAASIFSVAHYQDIPAAAQILLAFALAYYGHWISGSIFMLLALSLKVTSFLFIPAFVLVVLCNGCKGWGGRPFGKALAHSLARVAIVGLLLLAGSYLWDAALSRHANARFYPFESISRTVQSWQRYFDSRQQASVSSYDEDSGTPVVQSAEPVRKERPSFVITSYEKEIIANHPGDLRILQNYVIYGGVVLWIVVVLGTGWRLCEMAYRRTKEEMPSSFWLIFTGLSYVIPTAYLLRTAPDARFFLPAIPFLLLPFVEWFGRSPRIRITASIIAALAILQAGHVYAKIYQLRTVHPDLKAAIAHLREAPPNPPRVFMYPEGNYRLFPVKHDWYLRYWLRDFWQGDNDFRLEILHRERIGAIVVKKYLIGVPDADYTDLGIYPADFVADIDADPRFAKVFENARIAIYVVPPPENP